MAHGGPIILTNSKHAAALSHSIERKPHSRRYQVSDEGGSGYRPSEVAVKSSSHLGVAKSKISKERWRAGC